MISNNQKDLSQKNNLYQCLERLFPLRRSLSGPDNELTLRLISEYLDNFELKYFSEGSKVWDWTIPKYWEVKEAYILNSNGDRVFDGMDHSIKVISHSQSFEGQLDGVSLKHKIHTHPDLKDAIPYRTSYYNDDWGFCTSQSDLEQWLDLDEIYTVILQTKFSNKDMPYGEITYQGTSEKTILISTYICHPSMANDNLSGVVLTIALAQYLSRQNKLKYTWKLIWVPETIGALAWANQNKEIISTIEAAIVMSTCAGPGEFKYKAPYLENHWIEQSLIEVLESLNFKYQRSKFDPHGSDERQYSAPGIRIPCCSLHQSKYYDYPEYHTSLDDLNLVSQEKLERSLQAHMGWIENIEQQVFPNRIEPISGEYMLGPRGLYTSQGGGFLPGSNMSSLDLRMWILFYSDGNNSTSQIANKIAVDKESVQKEVEYLVSQGLLSV